MLASTRPRLSTEVGAEGVEILTLDGDFELAHAPEIGHRLTHVLNSRGFDLVVDLRGVSFLDSKTLRLLLSALRHCESQGRRLVLVRPNQHVWRVFEIAGFDRFFPSSHDLRGARARLSAPAR
jgi:anti-sigma B factor antagonist